MNLQTITFLVKQHCDITFKNGSVGSYYVIGIVNQITGRPALRMRHPHGFFVYRKVDEISKMEVCK